jgi:hypothetical protein
VSDDDKSPIDQALDLFVYAPLGFALSFREFSKQAAEKGRQQVQVAKMMGQFAAQMAGQQAEQKLSGARKQAEEVVGSFLPGGGRPSHVPAAPAPAPAPKPAAATTAATAEHVQTSAPPSTAPVTAPADPSVRTTTPDVPRTPPASSTPAPGAATLAIPAYDTLSASQVVQRLAGLSADELEAVRAYETAGRARKTILNKVEQLK